MKYFKITIFTLYCLIAFLLVSFPMYCDYDALYTVGEIGKHDFYLYVSTGAFGLILMMILSSIILGMIFVTLTKIAHKLRNKPSIGFFQKLWPYGLGILLVTSGEFKNELDKSKIESFGPYYRAKNGTIIHKGLTKEIVKDLVKNISLNKPNIDVFNQDEVLVIVNNVFDGKLTKVEDLRDTLVCLKEKQKTLQDLFEGIKLYRQKNLSVKYINEVKNFIENDKRSQALPHALVEDLIYEISVGGPKRQDKIIIDYHKLWFEYNYQLIEAAKEFCELLIVEHSKYQISNDEEGWKFRSENATVQYEGIIEKIKEIEKLREKLNQLTTEIQSKLNTFLK